MFGKEKERSINFKLIILTNTNKHNTNTNFQQQFLDGVGGKWEAFPKKSKEIFYHHH